MQKKRSTNIFLNFQIKAVKTEFATPVKIFSIIILVLYIMFKLRVKGDILIKVVTNIELDFFSFQYSL